MGFWRTFNCNTVLEGSYTLIPDFKPAIIYSMTLNLFVNWVLVAITFSGALTLLSLVRNSEEAGMQLLGDDPRAILVVRTSSVALSASVSILGVTVFDAYPMIFSLLHINENISFPGIFMTTIPKG